MTPSEQTSAEIKRAWCETDERPGEIGLRTDVHHLAICSRARRDGWQRPGETAPPSATLTQAGPNDVTRPKPRIRRRPGETINDRLMRLANRNLDFLEEQMESPEGMKEPADRERATKAIDTTTRIVDKLSELRANDQRANTAATGNASAPSGADIERRRLEIAERLERILAKRKSAEGPGGAAG